jgi:hypothetical protein
MQSTHVNLEMFCAYENSAVGVTSDALIETVVSFTDEIIVAIERNTRDRMTAS